MLFDIGDIVKDQSGMMAEVMGISGTAPDYIYSLQYIDKDDIFYVTEYAMSKYTLVIAGTNGSLPMGYGNADLSKALNQQPAKTKECEHEWQYYQGFREDFYFCKKCDKRKEA